MALTITSPNVLALVNSTERVSLNVQDATVDPPVYVSPDELLLNVTDIYGNVKFIDRWPQLGSRIYQSDTGRFFVDFGPTMATLDGVHASGSTVLAVLDALPEEAISWPAAGTYVDIDLGLPTYERVQISSVTIAGGAGAINLTTPTQFAHANYAMIRSAPRETDVEGEWIFNWQVRLDTSGEVTSVIQKVDVISTKIASLIPDLRLLIDKSRKVIQPVNDCYLGYTDSMLASFLRGGLENINAYQPSLTFTFADFPLTYRQILIDSALITGVMSQQLYAIDTDIPAYSDQGTSFVIVHQPQLASFLNQITGRLDRLIPQMKLQLLRSGHLHVQNGPNTRLNTLVESAPSGSLFRNLWFRS